MNFKTAAALMVVLVIGIFVGRATVKTTTPDNQAIADSAAPPASPDLSRLQQLVDVDVQDYYRLKNEEARFKKADEILSKILTIFLADLGLKISKPSAADSNVAPAKTDDSGTPPVEPATLATQTKKAEKAVDRLASRASLFEIRTPDEVADFLKASSLENFEDTIKTSSGFSNKAGVLQNMSGSFHGTALVLEDGKSERWSMEMRMNAKMRDGKLNGRRSLKLSKNGRVFSNSSGNGDLDQAYREIAGDPEAIVIAAGPDTFLQAYYMRSTDQIVGHVMRKGGLSEPYKSIGTFELSRF